MLLDTDILIDIEREHPPATAWYTALTALPDVPGIAALEFLQAFETKRKLSIVKAFLRPFKLVWPTEEDLARVYSEYLPLRLSHGIGLLDMIIAATATGRGEELATFNVRHYRAIPGLKIIQPYKR